MFIEIALMEEAGKPVDPSEFENLADRPEHATTALAYCQRLLRWRMCHEDQRMERWSAQFRYG